MKFRKKPVIVEAEQFHIMEWPNCPEGVEKRSADEVVDGEMTGRGSEWFVIKTLEGELYVSDGDWIITGVKGEKYPIRDDIFEATYEPIEE